MPSRFNTSATAFATFMAGAPLSARQILRQRAARRIAPPMSAFLLLVLVWLIWGISYPITAIALKGFDVMALRCFVQLLGAGVLFLSAAAKGQSFAVEREAWRD